MVLPGIRSQPPTTFMPKGLGKQLGKSLALDNPLYGEFLGRAFENADCVLGISPVAKMPMLT
jgi:hypothetical protein